MKIRVSQPDGDITLTTNGDAPRTWSVKNHVVDVDDADAPLFLASVAGSSADQEGVAESDEPSSDDGNADSDQGPKATGGSPAKAAKKE